MKRKILFLVLMLTGCSISSLSKTQDNMVSGITPTPIQVNTTKRMPTITTVIPAITPEITETQLVKSQIAHWLVYDFISEKYVVMILDENLNTIQSFSEDSLYDWINPQTCELIKISTVYARQSIDDAVGLDISRFRLSGELLDTQRINFSHKASDTYYQRISPSTEWIAYVRSLNWEKLYGKGDSLIQDVFIIPIDYKNKLEAKQLTVNNGAWIAPIAWSPDSRYLAFTDLDNLGNKQIFVYEPDSEIKTQLTNFDNRDLDYYVLDYEWSRDSQEIIFISGFADNEETNEQENLSTYALGTLNAESKEIFWIIPETEGLKLELWNIGNTGLVIVNDGDSYQWYDIYTGEMIHQYKLPAQIFMVSDTAETVYFWGGENYREYNIYEGKLKNTEVKMVTYGYGNNMTTLIGGDYFNCLIP
ncbi:MAG: hypothetical protein CVU39_22670 [Chloroflexi bacterium HGW-Chloroflexi-10]|nr:MAG: hypothetical protein CVU39_22670 [Chloroflexi bacterium HGW-Chloroflexi-10]